MAVLHHGVIILGIKKCAQSLFFNSGPSGEFGFDVCICLHTQTPWQRYLNIKKHMYTDHMFEMRAEYSMRRLVAVLAGANVRFTNKTFRELVGNMLRAEKSNIGGVVGSRHFPMAKRTLKELMRNLLRATDSVRILVVVNVAITLANNAMAGASGGYVVGK